MSSVIERGGAVAREIFDDRTRQGAEPLTERFVVYMLAEAFAHGAMWGLERAQHAVAITGAKYRTELEPSGLDSGRPQ